MRSEVWWDSRWMAAALALGAACFLTPRLPTLDDGYIILHSADAVLSGRDLVYGMPALIGVTSPAYLALIVVLEALRIPGLAAIYIATALGLAVCLYGLGALASELGIRGPACLALPAMAVTAGPVLFTLTNGLETGWATASIVWSLVCILRRQPYRAAALAGVLPCLRPDLAPIAAVLCLAAVWPLTWRRAAPLAVAALVALPFVLWLRLDTGLWWPQTLEAKRVFFAESCLPLQRRFAFAGELLASWLVWTLPLAIGLVIALFSRLGRAALSVAALVLIVYTLTLPGGIAHNDFRYLTPLLLPWALFGLAKALRASGRVGVAGAIAIIWTAGFILAPQLHKDEAFAQELVDVAGWVESNTPADSTVLVHDAGSISVFAHRRLVDLVGLKTPASVAAHEAFTWPSCGKARGDAMGAIADASGAGFVVVREEWERIFGLTGALEHAGWQLSLARAHPPGSQGYDVYRLQRIRRSPAAGE